MNPAHRYVLLCNDFPVLTTDAKEDLVTYLWGCDVGDAPHGPWLYTVLDYEVPYVVDTGDLDAFVERLP